jgi:hypothetical protein
MRKKDKNHGKKKHSDRRKVSTYEEKLKLKKK